MAEEGYLQVRGLIGYHQRDYSQPDSIVGLISYTEAGIDKYGQWNPLPTPDEENRDHWAFGRLEANRQAVYATTLEHCQRALGMKKVKSSSPPEIIGRWCDRWWQKFESGVRIYFEIEE